MEAQVVLVIYSCKHTLNSLTNVTLTCDHTEIFNKGAIIGSRLDFSTAAVFREAGGMLWSHFWGIIVGSSLHNRTLICNPAVESLICDKIPAEFRADWDPG